MAPTTQRLAGCHDEHVSGVVENHLAPAPIPFFASPVECSSVGIDDFELEPSSAEPEEWDPEADLHDPTVDGLTIPSVSTDEADAPPDVRRTFWTVTLVVNVAVLFVSIGPMLIYFRGWTREGLALIVAGLVLFGLAYSRYRSFVDDTPDEDHSPRRESETKSSTPQPSAASTTGPDHENSNSSHSTETDDATASEVTPGHSSETDNP